MDKLKQDISLGILLPGDKLMSTRELAIQLKVNPNTISRVYKELEGENIVFTKRGMGTFVVEDKNIIQNIRENMANEILTKFVEDLRELNISMEEAIKMLQKMEVN